MELQTRLIGAITYQQEDAITFPNGIPSFETEHAFLLLPIAGSEESLFCLQSVATPALSFILMNPFPLDPSYAPRLLPSELKALGADRDEDLCFYVFCVMKRPISQSTVNMCCPIAINPDVQKGCQVILEMDPYHMHHPLSEFSNSEGDSPC